MLVLYYAECDFFYFTFTIIRSAFFYQKPILDTVIFVILAVKKSNRSRRERTKYCSAKKKFSFYVSLHSFSLYLWFRFRFFISYTGMYVSSKSPNGKVCYPLLFLFFSLPFPLILLMKCMDVQHFHILTQAITLIKFIDLSVISYMLHYV